MEYFHQGKLKAIQPQNIFDAENIQAAFRKMQTGQHMGKILVRMPEDTSQICTLPMEEPVEFTPNASYLLIGGLGGLGIAISRWMVEKGARNLVFLSRSAGTTSRCRDFIQELAEMGCTANVVTGSVDNMDHVHAAISLCPGRLAGVIHLAMALKV
jgi:D-arabinose 1-dehydrogenase-like Zn-dependent alcohol dehydrogenase